jgi:glycosyltransferase involved in cell wall biosynthesis
VKQEPTVSILMNCYNGEKYLKEAVESVLAQTYQNWEIIFWDNQSTDRSAEIIKNYNDSRLKYFCAPEHTGLGVARAQAWEHLTGEFIAVLDVDDVWLSQKLEKQIPLFKDPEVGVVICDTLFFNEKTERPLYAGKHLPTGWVFEQLLAKYWVSLETVVFRRSTLLKLPRAFDSEFTFIADFDLVVRMSRISKLSLCPEVIAKWRVYDESSSWRSPITFVREKKRWLEKQVSEEPSFANKYSAAIRQFNNKNFRLQAVCEILDGNPVLAFKTLLLTSLDHWQDWALLFFCFIPFSSSAMSYLNNQRLKLSWW